MAFLCRCFLSFQGGGTEQTTAPRVGGPQPKSGSPQDSSCHPPGAEEAVASLFGALRTRTELRLGNVDVRRQRCHTNLDLCGRDSGKRSLCPYWGMVEMSTSLLWVSL